MKKITLEQYKKVFPESYKRLLRLQELKQKAIKKLQELRNKKNA